MIAKKKTAAKKKSKTAAKKKATAKMAPKITAIAKKTAKDLLLNIESLSAENAKLRDELTRTRAALAQYTDGKKEMLPALTPEHVGLNLTRVADAGSPEAVKTRVEPAIDMFAKPVADPANLTRAAESDAPEVGPEDPTEEGDDGEKESDEDDSDDDGEDEATASALAAANEGAAIAARASAEAEADSLVDDAKDVA